MDIQKLGMLDYEEAFELQRQLVQCRIDNEITDTLLLLEHPHTITVGVKGDRSDIHLSATDLQNLQATVVETDRGGELTYHGPGQLVCYPIFDLAQHGKDINRYLRSLEKVILATIKDYGLLGYQDQNHTGVWLGEDADARKIAAIGIKVSRWVSMHGFSINVNPDMDWFERFVPCGIRDKGVTSLQAEGIDVSMNEVMDTVTRHIKEIF